MYILCNEKNISQALINTTSFSREGVLDVLAADASTLCLTRNKMLEYILAYFAMHRQNVCSGRYRIGYANTNFARMHCFQKSKSFLKH